MKQDSPSLELAVPTLEQDAPSVEMVSASATKQVPPVVVGQGFNSVSGAGLSTAILGIPIPNNSTSEVNIAVCMTAEQVSTAMSISGSASASYVGSSASAKTSYYQSLQISTYTVTLVVYSKAQTLQTLTSPTFNTALPIPTNDKEAVQFFQTYGDSFLQQTAVGGEYIASFVFYCQTKQQQESLTTSLSANGVYGGATVNADLQTSLSTVTKSCNVNYTIKQFMTGVSGVAFPLVDKICTFADSFPTLAATGNAVISYDTRGYEAIPGLQTSQFEKIATNRSYMVGDGFLTGLARYLTEIQGAIDAMTALQSVYRYYSQANPDGQFVDEKLNQNLVTANSNKQQIVDQMQAYCANPVQDFSPLNASNLPALSNGTPALSINSDIYQYRPGDPTYTWNDIPSVEGAVMAMTSVASVEFFGGGDVNGIQTIYANYANVVNNSNPNATQLPATTTATHGNTNEKDRRTLVVNQNTSTATPQFLWQMLTHLNGTTIRYVWIAAQDATQIQCGGSGNYDKGNVPNAIFFPPYPAGSTWTLSTNAYPIGYCGDCHGSYLYQLGLKYFSFNPATWTALSA